MSKASRPVESQTQPAPPEVVEIDVTTTAGTDASANRPGENPQAACSDQPLAARVEAVLLSADRPLTENRLADLLGISGKGTAASIRAAVDDLNQQYQASGRCFRIDRLANGWQILTLPEFGPLVAQFHREREDSRLSQAALETLSIIAYRQPVLRAEIEAIRGVAAGDVLRGLLERRLVKIVGRAEELGRPMLYGTTSEFLRIFGLANLDDLPDVAGLTRRTQSRESKEKPQVDADGRGEEKSAGPEVHKTT
jgi:segregation and condensation protein B